MDSFNPAYASAEDFANFILNGGYVMGGIDDPTQDGGKPGTKGAIWIKVGVYGQGAVGVWQKQDDGISVNWTPLGGGAGGDIRSDGTVPFAADESMGGFLLKNLGAPVDADDATRKSYVDAIDSALQTLISNLEAQVIKKDGSVAFTGDQSMGGNQLQDLPAPVAANDATRKAYVDAIDTALQALISSLDSQVIKKDGSVDFTGPQSMNGFALTDVLDPVNPQDAATKAYVDSVAGSGVPVTTNVRYVAKNGNDGTGDGSIAKPFLTIQAAINSTGATAVANPVTILIAPGVYTENFIQIRPNMALVAMNPGSVSIVNSVTFGINQSLGSGTFNGGMIALVGIKVTSPVYDLRTTNANAFTVRILNCEFNGSMIFYGGGPTHQFYSQNSVYQNPTSTYTLRLRAGYLFSTNDDVQYYDQHHESLDANPRSKSEFVGTKIDALTSTGNGTPLLEATVVLDSSPVAQVIDPTYLLSVRASVDSLDATSAAEIGGILTLTSLAQNLGYVPAVSGNWLVVPTQVKAALDELAARNIAFTGTVYVAKNGSDVSGNGTPSRPYLTVKTAMDSILDATNLKRYALFVMPGRYDEVGLTLKANVFIIGSGQDWFTTRISNSTPIALDANFNVANDCRSGFHNINIASALSMDFNAVSSNQGKIYIRNCQITSTATFTRFSSINQVSITECQSFGLVTFNGCNSIIQDCDIFGGLTVNAVTGNNTDLVVLSSNLASAVSITGNGTNQVTVNFGANLMTSTLTAAGGMLTVNSDVTSLPSAPAFSGGAVLNRISYAQSLGFTPASAGNWSTPPVEVKGALDELASRQVKVEERIVTAPEAAAKQLILADVPFNVNDVSLAFGGIDQTGEGVDFSVTGQTVDWNGLGMDAIGVADGDVIVLTYMKE
jgi:pectin methylesterase-like acyl-CoA thioesterase